MRNEFGVSTLQFYDSAGQPHTYVCTGNPGISTAMKDDLRLRVGDVVGFFLHQGVSQGGTNAQYIICGIAFGRIMDVHLVGNVEKREIVVQPCEYTSGSIVVETAAPSTNGYVGRAVLVQ
jgi:hypothetical protein